MPVTRATRYRVASYAGASTVANTTTETDFSLQHTIRANALRIGKSYRVTGYAVYSSIAASAGTEQFTVKLNSTAIAATGGFTVQVGKTNAMASFDLTFTVTALGASGAVESQGRLFNETTNGGGQWFSMENTATVAIDTTVAQTLKLAFKWSVADVGNTITLRQLIVEELG